MSTLIDCPPASKLSIRMRDANPNHHLWCNHGIWFIHYTLHCGRFMKHRMRFSLNTKSVVVARSRRDAILAEVTSPAE